jgi:ferritin-like metal-binding protein YciE
MKEINDLEDLLLRLLNDLRCGEVQIAESMPGLIEKAKHRSLANALKHHHAQTEDQLARLDKIIKIMSGVQDKGIAAQNCKGISGLLSEVNELMECKLSPDVIDAAIIASVQKIEHYEICTYGTALAYAEQLHMREASALLEETLNEEYDADDLLTALATSALNKDALPEGMETENTSNMEVANYTSPENTNGGKVVINERTIQSPGGRAGRSHRGYSSGESRGH